MIKIIVIFERIFTSVIWRINVNEFDLAAELLLEAMQDDEVVAFDNEIFAQGPISISAEGQFFTIYPPHLC